MGILGGWVFLISKVSLKCTHTDNLPLWVSCNSLPRLSDIVHGYLAHKKTHPSLGIVLLQGLRGMGIFIWARYPCTHTDNLPLWLSCNSLPRLALRGPRIFQHLYTCSRIDG